MGLAAAAGIGAAASLAGGLIQSGAAKSAAKQQTDAANNAAALQYAESQQANQLIQSIYSQNTARLQPFVGAGTASLSKLLDMTSGPGGLTKAFDPTMSQLAQTPGYKFALDQGLLGVQAGASATGQGSAVSAAPGTAGIGPSGPLGKGLANYAEGLASTTYQQQFQNYWAQNQAIYNMLAGITNTGENAAAQTGTMGTAAGGQGANALITGAQGYGSYSTAGAAAGAAGTVGSANALTNGLTGIGNSAMMYGVLGNGGASNGTVSSLMGVSSNNPVF